MPLYNVSVSVHTTMVVVANDINHARQVAQVEYRQAFDDDGYGRVKIEVTGAVNSAQDLRDGWNVRCLPYGGDGNARLKDLLTPNSM